MKLRFSMIAVTIVALAVSCTSRERKPLEVGKRSPAPTVPGDDNRTTPFSPGTTPKTGDKANVSAQFDQAVFVAYKVDLDNLTYKFKYLDIEKDGEVKFDANGKASIRFNDLPVGQTGDLVLDFYENNTLRLRGEEKAYTLKKEGNILDLTLREINGGNGGGEDTTDLIIDVIIEDDNNGGGNNGGGNNGGGNNGGGNNGGGNNGGGNNGGGNNGGGNNGGGNNGGGEEEEGTLPADWDGKSFKGNAKWKIEAVQG